MQKVVDVDRRELPLIFTFDGGMIDNVLHLHENVPPGRVTGFSDRYIYRAHNG